MIITLLVLITSFWVYFDAKKIGVKSGQVDGFFSIGPVGWFWCTLLIWIVGFPMYLIKRPELIRIAGINSVEADDKKCPECAEIIKTEATKCRFCGHMFSSVLNSTLDNT